MQPLKQNGLSVFYIDESVSEGIFVTTAIRIPMIAPTKEGPFLVWEDYLDAATKWRRELGKATTTKSRPELHGRELITGHGRMHKTGRSLTFTEGHEVYSTALKTLDWLPDESIMTTFATRKSSLFWATGIEAAMVGLFQRIRRNCDGLESNAMIIFDEGHREYIKFYRRSVRYLPTGSSKGAWEDGAATKNLALSTVAKDANSKDSKLSLFLQVADLVSYAALLKLKRESGLLSEKRVKRRDHELYDLLPLAKINCRATTKRKDGLVPI